ncbi:MAG: hypothetical protein ABFD82_20795 [Syntrophaceae bacterium]
MGSMSTSIYMDIRIHMITSMNMLMARRNIATSIRTNTPMNTSTSTCMNINTRRKPISMTMNIKEITDLMSMIIPVTKQKCMSTPTLEKSEGAVI